MKVEDLFPSVPGIEFRLFDFTSRPSHGSLIACPACRASSVLSRWMLATHDCDICGAEHQQMICPACGHAHDEHDTARLEVSDWWRGQAAP